METETATRDEIVQVLNLLAQNFRQTDQITDLVIDTWCDVLAEFTGDELRQAARQWLVERRFFPALSELIQLANELASERLEAEANRRTFWRAMDAFNHGRMDDPAVALWEKRNNLPPWEERVKLIEAEYAAGLYDDNDLKVEYVIDAEVC
jgi:hypothetical protein